MRLTEQGKTLVENTVARLIDKENEALGAWTEEEQAVYLKLTERFLLQMKEKAKEL